MALAQYGINISSVSDGSLWLSTTNGLNHDVIARSSLIPDLVESNRYNSVSDEMFAILYVIYFINAIWQCARTQNAKFTLGGGIERPNTGQMTDLFRTRRKMASLPSESYAPNNKWRIDREWYWAIYSAGFWHQNSYPCSTAISPLPDGNTAWDVID